MTDPRDAPDLDQASRNPDGTYDGAKALSWLSNVLTSRQGLTVDEIREAWEDAKARHQELGQQDRLSPRVIDLIDKEIRACPFRPDKIHMSQATWLKLRSELQQSSVILVPPKPNGLPIDPRGCRYAGLELRISPSLPYYVIQLST